MAEQTGSEIRGRSLKNEGSDPLLLDGRAELLAEGFCNKEGIPPLDVVALDMMAVVDVKTDDHARAGMIAFTDYSI